LVFSTRLKGRNLQSQSKERRHPNGLFIQVSIPVLHMRMLRRSRNRFVQKEIL